MEFQFGTNWARFSHYAGPVVGQTLFMEGVFAFFAESSFLGVLLFGERRVEPRDPLALLRHGRRRRAPLRLLHRRHQRLDAASGRVSAIVDGRAELTSLWGLLTNPYARWQYPHVDLRRDDRRARR